jgi:hypothetical protein
MSLAASQAALAELLRRPAPLAANEERAHAIASGNDRLTAVEQVDVYREQFFLRHVDALREDFATIAHLLGDDAFEKLAHDYLEKHPPSTFSLRDLGAAFPAFVADDALLSDLARLEWAFVEAFDAKDAPPFEPSSIATASEDAWPGARIELQPAVQLLALGHAAHDYRAAVKRQDAPERPSPAPSFVVVYRGPSSLSYIDIERDAFELLAALARGTPLGEACELAARASGAELPAFQEKLGGWFAEWTQRGWIARVDFG